MRRIRLILAMALLSATQTFGSCEGAEGPLAAAQVALSRGQPSAIESSLAALAKGHPDCSSALVLRAQVEVMKGRPQEAEKLFVRACELAPNQPEPFFALGAFYDGRQQSRQAAEQFEKVVKLTPSDPQAHDYLGLSREALGQFQQAERAYQTGFSVNRGPRFDPMLYYNYGRFLMKQNRLQDAKRHLDQAAELVPNMRAVFYERAKLAEKLGDLADARLNAERALGLKDARGVILDLQVYYMLSRIYRSLGETELAQKYVALSREAKVPVSARTRDGR